MREKSFSIGSIIRGGESIYLKDRDETWSAFDLSGKLTASEAQKLFDVISPYAVKFEVLYKPDPARVLEDLPSGSIVSGGEHEVAIKFEDGWSISGSESWYDSSDVLEILGDEFEVLRRGETD